MNTRDYKVFRLGNYYHIYNRGNNKGLIFLDRYDYLAFLVRLEKLLGLSKAAFDKRVRITPFEPGEFSLFCYCLMPNHFHFLIRQNGIVGLDKFMLRLMTSYSKYFNKRHARVGHVFQGRFKAKLIGTDSYLAHVSGYIHANPKEPFDYEFSSLPDYCRGRKSNLANTEVIMNYFNNSVKQYEEYVRNCEKRKMSKAAFDIWDIDLS